VKQYNAEVLEEIEKVKEKLGGKCYASTESLMKAMVVPDMTTEPSLLGWESKSPFYNMVSQGKKKLKKRRRNGKSQQKKGLSVRK
jgi:hypothetical protein